MTRNYYLHSNTIYKISVILSDLLNDHSDLLVLSVTKLYTQLYEFVDGVWYCRCVPNHLCFGIHGVILSHATFVMRTRWSIAGGKHTTRNSHSHHKCIDNSGVKIAPFDSGQCGLSMRLRHSRHHNVESLKHSFFFHLMANIYLYSTRRICYDSILGGLLSALFMHTGEGILIIYEHVCVPIRYLDPIILIQRESY